MKKIIQQIKSTLSKVFGSFLTFIVDRGQIAVTATNILKSIIENPALSFVTELTPNKKDDALLAKAKKLIPDLAVKVGLAMAIIKEYEVHRDKGVALQQIISQVREHLPEEGKAIFYREISGAIAEALSDGTLSTAEAVAIVQLVFKKVL